MAKKISFAIAGFFVLVFFWHVIVASQIDKSTGEVTDEDDVSISSNWITNVITLTIYEQPGDWAGLGTGFAVAMLPPMMERELQLRSRRWLDLYAVLIPWTVEIDVRPPSEDAARRHEEQAEQRAAERLAAREAERVQRENQRREAEQARARVEAEERANRLQYAAHHLGVRDVKVADGERFGRRVKGVFGTVENKGEKTLQRVEIRVFFLDDAGNRIGEKDFLPVLSGGWSSNDPPLRPGYRSDFGFNLDDHAPSGWSGRIEHEVVDIEFSEDS